MIVDWFRRLRGNDAGQSDATGQALRDRYLSLLKKSLLNDLYPEMEAQLLHTVLCVAHRQPVDLEGWWAARRNPALLDAIAAVRDSGDTLVLRGVDERGEVIDRPDLRNVAEFPHTMIGRARLDHLQWCCETVLREAIDGDFFEAGVWRGGACALMAGVLAAHGDRARRVWIADSFRGVPPPSLPQDRELDLSERVLPVLSVPEDEVRALLERYDVLDDARICFVSGWFSDSLRACEVERIAVLRIDADLYESTLDVLTHLYPRVVDGGIVIVDDYGILRPCQLAVDEFRAANGINESMQFIDGHGVFWRRQTARV